MNAHVERTEEAIVTIEVAGGRVEPRALLGSRLRRALGQEGHATRWELSTPPSCRPRRRDASPADGAGRLP